MLDNYVTCGWRRMWIMWDLDNGHACHKNDPGKGYAWIFKTRKEALNHRRQQHKRKHRSRLSMPIKIEGNREF